MKANMFVSLVALLTFAFSAHSVIGKINEPKTVLPYRTGRLLIKMSETAPSSALEETAFLLGATPIKDFPLIPGLFLYEYDEAIDIEDAVTTFLENSYVEYAEPDYYYQIAAQNDPLFPQEWALENNGQTGGTVDADINANTMWAIEDGNQNVVIGVIDSGVDYRHTDLLPNLWRNPLEIAGNGIDEDGNGYVDDVFGINAINNTGNPMDDNAHGTHVAGTIGADGNNSIGIVGVTQNVQIISCKFLAANGSGSTSDAIQCLQYFSALKTRLENPVNIIATNNSWGSSSSSTALRDAIRAHQNLGILFFAAAGNDGQNNDVSPSYPANYELSNIISVAATDHNDRIASFSNYGNRNVHVAAPGVRILSTVPNQTYALMSGTSMATPHVTGLAAVVKARFPDYDYRQIKNVILSSGTPLTALTTKTVTGRRIRGADTNGRGALTCANQTVSSRLRPITNSMSLALGNTLFLSALRINCSVPLGALTVFSDGVETVTLQDNGLNGDLVANDGIYSLNWRPLRPMTYALNFGNGDVVTVTTTGSLPPATYTANVVPYAYTTITGTSLNVADETIRSVAAPFPISYNGQAPGYTTLYVSSNGTVSFTNNTAPGYTNTTLPRPSFTTLLAVYWDDLIPSGTNSNVFVETRGSAPNRQFIIEWRNMRNYNSSGTGTFQVIFYENSSDVRQNYLDTNFGSSAYNFGASATVGAQTSALVAVQYSYNAANIPSSFSLLFRRE